jgi:hypothetical protein
MACAYHAEVNAMQAASPQAMAAITAFGANGGAVVQAAVGGGVANFVWILDHLDALHTAINTYVNSANFPAGASPARQAQITFRRQQPFLQYRLNGLAGLIAGFQALGQGLWPGLGAPWF